MSSGAGASHLLGSIRESASPEVDAAASSQQQQQAHGDSAAAARIVEMARHLDIDPDSEFFLIPLAQQALELSASAAASAAGDEWGPAAPAARPHASSGAGAGANALGQAELQWFRERVQEERRQFQAAPWDNSPWILISDTEPAAQSAHASAAATAASSRPISASTGAATPTPMPRSYFYNFQTHRRAPPDLQQQQNHADLFQGESPLAFFNDGQFVTGDDTRAMAHAGGSHFRHLGASSSCPPRVSRLPSSGFGGVVGGSALPELSAMRFTSWFVEGGAKRYVRIIYWMIEEEFEVHLLAPGAGAGTATAAAAAAGAAAGAATGSAAVASVADSTRVYRIKSLRCKHGAASCWDLHLQATLFIFGRPTTLLQCDSGTRAWVEGGARRLLRVRELLAARLSRYQRTAEPRQSRVPLVEVHLRALMRDVAALKNQLAKHRPAVAERYQL